MIDRDGTWIEIACDECGTLTGDAFDRDEFREMTTAAKRDGWTIKPDRGGWRHECPGCSEPAPPRVDSRTQPPPLDDLFDDEDEPPRLTFDPDIEALLGPSKDHDR